MAPFVGRETELERLHAAFRGVAGGLSRLVLLTGDPGIGKTRLLEEFRRSVARARCLVARGSPLAKAVPFSVLAEALQSHLRTLPAEAVRALCGAGIRDLAVVLPSAAGALGSAPDAPSSRLGLLEAFAGLLGAIAAEGPLVLELDDLHQADPSTWEVLAYLGRSPLAAPVLIIAALRTASLASDVELGRLIDDLRKDGLAEELRLAPLERAAVDELAVASLGPTEATADLTEWLFGRSRGNALFTVALLEELATDPSKRVVPASVKERVRVAVDGLEAEPRASLEAGAVLGRTFSLRAVATLVDREPDGLDELVVGGFLTDRVEEGIVEYDFVHPLVQESVYENMSVTRRVALHRRAAAYGEGDVTVRAYHAARGATVGDADALALIRDAARLEEQRQSHREALAHLRAALALTPADAVRDRVELLDEIAWQAAQASDHGVGIPALEELSMLVADDQKMLGTTKMRLASFLATGAGDLASAGTAAEDAVRLFEACGATDRVPAALNELAWIRGESGDLLEQVRMSGEAIAQAEAMSDAPPDTRPSVAGAVMHALGAHGHGLALLGRTNEAIAAGRRSLGIAQERNEHAQVAWHTGVLADAYVLGGRPAEGAAIVDPLIAAGPAASDVAYFTRARANWFLGRWDDALADCKAIQAMHPTMPSVHSAWTLSLAALLLVVTGRAGEAEPFLAEAERTYGDRHFYAFSCWHDWASGCARWFSGDLDVGRARLERAATWAEQLDSPPLLAHVLPDVIEASIEVDDLQDATRWAERLAGLGTDSPMARVAARYGEGLIVDARGDRAGAAELFTSASAAAQEITAPFIAARAFERLATVVPRPASIEPLVEAARTFSALPAPAFAERVVARLRAVGPAGRRASQTVGGLTAREHEVAMLARGGSSTKQIAGRLHLSERTVESHLAHVYRKLQIEGRHELAGWDPAGGGRA